MTADGIARILAEAGIESARAEARLLIERFAGVSPAHVLAFPEEEYVSPALEEAVRRRAERYPLQYLFGEWEFMGLPFYVDESCLIPRSDTEPIAEAAIERLRERGGGLLLDLCTGSGCIAASVLHYTERTEGFAVELDPGTAETARRNLRRLNLGERCQVIVGDASVDLFPPEVRFDVITANPPYIPRSELPSLEPELSYEPRLALTDEGDGLSLLRAILEVYAPHLAPGGLMLLEHGWRQSEAVRSFAQSLGLSSSLILDYGGRERGAAICWRGGGGGGGAAS